MKFTSPAWSLPSVLILYCTFALNAGRADAPKEARVNEVVTVMESLTHLAKKETPNQGQRDFNADVRKAVETAIPKLDADQLGKMAIICLTLYHPGNAENVGYDEVYYAGFWVCADRLFKKGDESSVDALRFVQDHAHLDGGERLQFDEAMEDLEKRRHH
jgi:hypothetical protein